MHAGGPHTLPGRPLLIISTHCPTDFGVLRAWWIGAAFVLIVGCDSQRRASLGDASLDAVVKGEPPDGYLPTRLKPARKDWPGVIVFHLDRWIFKYSSTIFFPPQNYEPASFSYLTIRMSDDLAEVCSLLSTRKWHQHCKYRFIDACIFLNIKKHILAMFGPGFVTV